MARGRIPDNDEGEEEEGQRDDDDDDDDDSENCVKIQKNPQSQPVHSCKYIY
jgi:hypothetical protein